MDSAVVEVLEVTARCGTTLAEILRTSSTFAVGLIGRSGHLHETHLADLHSGVERDRKTRDVGQLEGDMAIETGVDEAGGGVNEQAEASEAALAFDTGDEIVGNGDPLECGAEYEFARVQHEDTVFGDLDQLGESGHVLFDVDDAGRVIAEDAKEIRHPNVDRRRLDHRFIEWIDDDAASGQGFSDAAVGQDHG